MPRPALRPLVDADDTAQAQDDLVREMLAGSRRAWATFHARYDRLMLGCIHKVVVRFPVFVDKDDEVPEIYGALLVGLCAHDMSRLRSFSAARGNLLGTWLGLLAVHCAYDRLRVLRREPDRASLDECEDMDSADPTPDQVLERKEQIALVSDILRDFPEKDREFVSLYFDEELDVEQIAARMRISVNTVYSKKRRIQSRLEARLSETRLAA